MVRSALKRITFKTIWQLCTGVGVRRLGKALAKLGAYSDTLFYYDVAMHPQVNGFVSLTIDDGLVRGGAERCWVDKVSALLKQHGAKATFMVCKNYLQGVESSAKMLVEEGHELGNHMTEDRGDFASLPEPEFEKQLVATSQAIEEASGCQPKWFRPPMAKMTEVMRQVVGRHNMQIALGDCYCDDWAIEDPDFVSRTMLRQVESGSVIILHMPETGFREHTLKALEVLLEGLQARQLQCVTLSELHRLAHRESQSTAGNAHPAAGAAATS
mmetsp:Transcript_64849/g.154833  ORF Transcript_64849/g.154833 Transcript_64849/m.154833 type:complete len:271 (-) Transcript_64849:125-937(-)|eukprot:CAMPEP_0178385374 /NCGR_PEP_ID=MMETSP0689_2-20121128/8000_1 /TAXON_ID=160604 /ORGANISM="Amphidinium massartii, Strain CS-259" /LENGTH=270 /DNA_ID=CAMNT_0020005655 /DNA_START=58 /DNA_END=870 /DNA_ORIENTATION=-